MKVSLLLGAAALMSASATHAFAATGLSGKVTSAKEGAMEGVLVTAKKDGSNMSLTVVSDDKGQYSFPAGRLEPGHYALKIRAIGYVLNGPKAVDVTANGTTADVKLNDTANIAPQMTNSEWLASAPGTEDQKRDLVACATCHTLSRPLMSAYTKDQLKTDVFARMADFSSQGAQQFWGALLTVLFLSGGAMLLACLYLPRGWREKGEDAGAPQQVDWRRRWRFGTADFCLRRRRWLEENPFYWLGSRDRRPRLLAWGILWPLFFLWTCFLAGAFSNSTTIRARCFGFAVLVAFAVQPGWWAERYRANVAALVERGLIDPARHRGLLAMVESGDEGRVVTVARR